MDNNDNDNDNDDDNVLNTIEIFDEPSNAGKLRFDCLF